MSTERDELADELADSIFRYTGVTTSSSKSMADELLAAGYRRPQQVTTEAEMQALPMGSVIRLNDRGYVYARHYNDSVFPEDDWVSPLHHVFDADWLPATVLHRGAE